MGERQYARYVNMITASGYALGMNRVCIGYESSMLSHFVTCCFKLETGDHRRRGLRPSGAGGGLEHGQESFDVH